MKFDLRILQNSKQKKIINGLVIIFCIGLAFILLSKENKGNKEGQNEIKETNIEKKYQVDEESKSYSDQVEKKLETEFSKIEGAGKVDVIIVLKTKGEIVLNKDEPYASSRTSENDKEGGTRENADLKQDQVTIIVRKNDGSEEAIVIKELLPEVNGIVILAEGGDDLLVKNNLINAAKVLLDLPAHKIEVMKRARNNGGN